MIARERHLLRAAKKLASPEAIRSAKHPALAKPFEPIVRERVIDIFRTASEHRVTLVVAPAGFGKSVAVRHYLERDNVPHLRLALRREHETLLGFLTGFSTAISPVAPEALNCVATAYEAAAPSRTCVAELAAWLTSLLTPFQGTIVVDDLHLTSHDARIGELISELIERTPENKWILITRDDSAIAAASWIGYGFLGKAIVAPDLAINFDEAAEIAQNAQAALNTEELKELLVLTQAWPVAFAFSIHSASQTNDLRVLASGTREMIYAFLADQVLRKLEQKDRDFLLATALFPTLDFELLVRAGFSDPVASIESVRRSTAFVSAERNGVFRYHDLFRDFLDAQLRQSGKQVYSAACGRAASLLAGVGNFIDATELYSRAGLTSEAAALLDGIAFTLADTNRQDLVEGALQWLERSNERPTPRVIALLAYMKRSRGEYDEAERLFRHAIDSAPDPELRIELALRYTALLGFPTQRYSDALAVIDSVSVYPPASPLLHVRLRARRALLLSYLGKGEEATALADLALSEVCNIDPLNFTRLSVTLSVAQVALNCERFERAYALARDCIRIAEDPNSAKVVHGALCVVAQATHDQGKIAECNSVVKLVREVAERTGNRDIRHYYLAVSYDLAMCRGDSEAIGQLEVQLDQESKYDLASIASLGLVYSLRAARTGDFQEAYDIALRSHFTTVPSHRLYNSGRLAMYAAAAGMTQEANEQLTSFNAELSKRSKTMKDSFVVSQGRAFVALAALLIDRASDCARQLAHLERHSSRRYVEVGYLAKVIRSLQVHRETGSGSEDVVETIKILRTSALGGYADVIEHIAFTTSGKLSGFALLTETELKVLRLLNSGATSRQIAANTERSAFTIDTHVKAIARKLNCKGRREAVAIARARGIL